MSAQNPYGVLINLTRLSPDGTVAMPPDVLLLMVRSYLSFVRQADSLAALLLSEGRGDADLLTKIRSRAADETLVLENLSCDVAMLTALLAPRVPVG